MQSVSEWNLESHLSVSDLQIVRHLIVRHLIDGLKVILEVNTVK